MRRNKRTVRPTATAVVKPPSGQRGAGASGRGWLALVFGAALGVLALLPASLAQPAPASATSVAQVVVRGDDWLSAGPAISPNPNVTVGRTYGLAVCYSPGGAGTDCIDPATGQHVSAVGGDVKDAALWQCVELAQRVWQWLDWDTNPGGILHFGNGDTDGLAANLWFGTTSGTDDNNAVEHPNGSGYVPQPGDLIVTWSSGATPI